VLGTPLVEHAFVRVGNGKQLEIEVVRRDPTHAYIQSFTLNGRAQQRAWFRHADIAQGGHIRLEMGPEPKLDFASAPDQAPPSLQL
jgi:putative alpha-1,2-mannosidase